MGIIGIDWLMHLVAIHQHLYYLDLIVQRFYACHRPSFKLCKFVLCVVHFRECALLSYNLTPLYFLGTRHLNMVQ